MLKVLWGNTCVVTHDYVFIARESVSVWVLKKNPRKPFTISIFETVVRLIGQLHCKTFRLELGPSRRGGLFNFVHVSCSSCSSCSSSCSSCYDLVETVSGMTHHY